jgi:hypothetical protein
MYGSHPYIRYTTAGIPRLIRFFTGRSDHADRSHFTIDYEVGDIRTQNVVSNPAPEPLTAHGTIDGWLRDDDAVVVKPRGVKPLYNNWSLNDLPESPTTAPAGW